MSVKPPISVAIAVNVSSVPAEKSFSSDLTMYISPVLLTAKYVVGKPVWSKENVVWPSSKKEWMLNIQWIFYEFS